MMTRGTLSVTQCQSMYIVCHCGSDRIDIARAGPTACGRVPLCLTCEDCGASAEVRPTWEALRAGEIVGVLMAGRLAERKAAA